MRGSTSESGKYFRLGATLVAAASVGLATYAHRDQLSDPLSIIRTVFSDGGRADPMETVVTHASRWKEVRIPSEANGAKFFFAEVKNVELFQSTPIGLRQLYLFPHDTLPVIGIAAIFDPATTKIRGSAFSLDGLFGFQEVTEPFTMDPREIKPLHKDTITTKEVIAFGIESVRELDRMLKGALGREEVLLVIQLRPWPQPNTPTTIIFDEAVVEHKGKPSEATFITIKFIFENSNRRRLPSPQVQKA